jgi:hypothetical protein
MPRDLRSEPRVQVITANLLRAGHVVWLDADGGWTRDLARAQAYGEPAEAEAALARASTRTDEVVGCYLAPMRPTDAGLEPVHFREAFRRAGPSPRARGLPQT